MNKLDDLTIVGPSVLAVIPSVFDEFLVKRYHNGHFTFPIKKSESGLKFQIWGHLGSNFELHQKVINNI